MWYIRDNILFSHEYDEQFYNMVLDGEYYHPFIHARSCDKHDAACALRPDLDLFSDGDDTIVGEKGITVRSSRFFTPAFDFTILFSSAAANELVLV
jgi:hypothetical protein